MPNYRNVSPQGDQVVEGQFVKSGESFETDADLDGNPNFERVDGSQAAGASEAPSENTTDLRDEASSSDSEGN